MKYNETIAYQCRYGEVAERIGGGYQKYFGNKVI